MKLKTILFAGLFGLALSAQSYADWIDYNIWITNTTTDTVDAYIVSEGDFDHNTDDAGPYTLYPGNTIFDNFHNDDGVNGYLFVVACHHGTKNCYTRHTEKNKVNGTEQKPEFSHDPHRGTFNFAITSATNYNNNWTYYGQSERAPEDPAPN